MTHNNVVYNAAGAMNNYAYNNAQHPNSVNAYPTTHNNNAIPPNNIAYNSFGVANQGQVPESVIIGNISSNCSVASGLTTAPAIPNGNPNSMLQAVPPMMMGVQQPQQAVPIVSLCQTLFFPDLFSGNVLQSWIFYYFKEEKKKIYTSFTLAEDHEPGSDHYHQLMLDPCASSGFVFPTICILAFHWYFFLSR